MNLDTRTEKAVQRDVKDVLALHGCIVSDLSQPRASMQTPGLPDLYVQDPKRKRHFWLEVKKEGGRLSGFQKAWHESERAAGGEVYVVRSAADAHEVLMERER